MNFLQRLNVSNNQLLTLLCNFDPLLAYVNIANNINLTEFSHDGSDNLMQVVGTNWEMDD